MFIPSTKAKGCLVTIVNTDTLKTMATKIHRLQDNTSATQCFTLSDIGNYLLLAYDWEEYGGISVEAAVTSKINLTNTLTFVTECDTCSMEPMTTVKIQYS